MPSASPPPGGNSARRSALVATATFGSPRLTRACRWWVQALDLLTHNVWTTCLARRRGVPLFAFNLEEDSHGFFREAEDPLYSPAAWPKVARRLLLGL